MIFITFKTPETVGLFRTLLTSTDSTDLLFMVFLILYCASAHRNYFQAHSLTLKRRTMPFSRRGVPFEPQGSSQDNAACLSGVQPPP